MRVKSGVYSRNRKKKYFKLAKGSYASKRNRWRMVLQHVEKGLNHSFRGRKDKKADYKSLWVGRINALTRELGYTYSKFINGLKKANISINRKMLADMAVNDVDSFRNLVELAKKAQ